MDRFHGPHPLPGACLPPRPPPPLAQEGPNTGQEQTRRPPRRSKRARVAERPLQDAQDIPKTAPEASKTSQEALKRRAKRAQRSTNCLIPLGKRMFLAYSHLGPSQCPRRPKRASRRPKGPPRGLQDGPRRALDGPGGPDDGPRRPQDGPNRRPRGFQEGPRRAQEAPRRHQEAPKRPQEARRGPPEAPRRPPTSPKRLKNCLQDAPKMSPICLQDAPPRSPNTAPKMLPKRLLLNNSVAKQCVLQRLHILSRFRGPPRAPQKMSYNSYFNRS